MDLEELELRFRANYGDVLQKMDELTSLIGQKTNDMQVKIQSNLDRIQQNMNACNSASSCNRIISLISAGSLFRYVLKIPISP